MNATTLTESGPSNPPPSAASASDVLQPLRSEPFSGLVDDLENLLSQCRVAFLLGAGCSYCAGLPLMDGLTTSVQQSLGEPAKAVLAGLVANFKGAGRCTIEDYMSELVDLISLTERRKQRGAADLGFDVGSVTYDSSQLVEVLDCIKRAIARCIATPTEPTSIETHRKFVRAVQSAIRSGKAPSPRVPFDLFTLNYDTLFEDALALERIAFTDGFIGGATGWWDINTYRDASVSARIFKLHGSIDWCQCDGDVLPRRIRSGLQVLSRQDHLLIWPAATKYRETQRDPYAQLISLMRDALRPQANTEVVVCICGYAFADEHINVEIDRAIRESNERLTLVAFTSDSEPTGQLKLWHDDRRVNERVRIYANHGFFHADQIQTSKAPLPWWQFEVLTKLLSGER